MDVITFVFNAENMRTLLLAVVAIVGFVWLDRRIIASENRQNQRMDGIAASLREEMAGIAVSLREEMAGIAASLRGEMAGIAVSLREEMAGIAVSLREEMAGIASSLRREIDERFTVFHKTLKENDFAHLNETIKALTFTLQKNGILEPEDKKFVDSHLDGG